MRITFQTGNISETDRTKSQEARGSQSAGDIRAGGAGQAAFFSRDRQNWFGPNKGQSRKGSSVREMQEEMAFLDVSVQQNYMTIMSHTMSKEDYAKLSEEGFHYEQMEPGEAVTILDKIKAEMVRSGQVVAGYTDDLDMDALAAALGSEALARELVSSFQQADVPLTQDTVDSVRQAWDMASELEEPTEGTYHYMIDNGMEPSVEDFYLAQNSGAQSIPGGQEADGAPVFYAEDIQGYYSKSAGAVNMDAGSREAGGHAEGQRSAENPAEDALWEQIDRVIAESGREVNAQTRQEAAWLMERNLPLTAENLERLETLREVEFPVREETFARAAADAVARGKKPAQGDLSGGDNLYEKAAEVLEKYQSDEGFENLAGDLTARRQLEEIRLRMTAEVNVRLLKSGFAIDTAPMEQLLEALRQAERQVSDSLFAGQEDAVGKYHLYQHTNQVMEELPGLPADLLGPYSRARDAYTLAGFHEEGVLLQDTYRRAERSYEALMTAPRRDLGDSIRKAFANVDAILEDLGYSLTEENKRVVRILGYNRMDINSENIEAVRAADRQVRSVIEKMTPAATLKMIRDGVNPLEKSFEELQEYFEQSGGDYEESAESYSRFLYGLEKHHEITEEERSAYIGVYRMMYQIEHSDGAAVGALVNTQAQVQFSNLLSAVRSGKFKSMDVKVEEAFGTVSQIVQKGETITEQIARGFAREVKSILEEISYSEQAQKDYQTEALDMLRQTAVTDSEAEALLQRGEFPVNAANLLAAQALAGKKNNLFGDVQPYTAENAPAEDAGSADGTVHAEESGQSVLSKEAVSRMLDSMENKEEFREVYRQAMEKLQDTVQEASIAEAEQSLDVRSLRMANRQLSIAVKMADSEEYILPMYIGEKLSKVHLKLEQGGREKGSVHIAVNLPQGGRMEAHFTLKDKRISGFLVGNTEEEVTKLEQTVDIFSKRIHTGVSGLENMTLEKLPVVGSDTYMGMDAGVGKTDGADNRELYRIAKVFLGAVQEEEVA